MTTTKRTIRGEKYDIAAIVDESIAAVDGQPLDTAGALDYLVRQGHQDPAAELINRVAREKAILARMQKLTGATFTGQLGKINFDNRDAAIRQANAYLDRRNAGHRSRWGK